MSQSSTLYIGMDVHKDSIAVAYVAQEHGEVMDTMKIHILLLQKPNAEDNLLVWSAAEFQSGSSRG